MAPFSFIKGPILHQMEVTAFTDPVKIGPGLWFKLHLDAVQAVTDELKRAFVINTQALVDNFKCAHCQEHFRAFVERYPLTRYWNIHNREGQDIGFFQWTWELHNQVNKRYRKYQPTLEEAYLYYSQAKVGLCFDCGKSDPPAPVAGLIQEYREKKITPQPFTPHGTGWSK